VKTIENVIGDIMEVKEKRDEWESDYKELWKQLNSFCEEKKRKEFVEVIDKLKDKILVDVEDLSKEF